MSDSIWMRIIPTDDDRTTIKISNKRVHIFFLFCSPFWVICYIIRLRFSLPFVRSFCNTIYSHDLLNMASCLHVHLVVSLDFSFTMKSSSDASETMTTSPPFPTAATIPFPYPSGPYPQQLSLMDTLLRTLETLDKSTSETKQHGHVLMLESPTGTGKSLSLACAALAWLRHREIRDMEDIFKLTDQNQLEQPSTQSRSNSSAQTLGSEYDWLDNWQSSEDIARKQEDQKNRQRCHTIATAGRTALQHSLSHIRKQLKDGRLNERNRNSVRIALMKQAILDASRHHHVELKKGKRKRNDEDDNTDFCLAEYKSDDEALHPGDEDDQSINTEDDNIHEVKVGPIKTSRQILLGGSLDGSNVIPVFKHYPVLRQSSSSSSKKLLTIGNVQPGQGVRKIIYSARTHSQLSQFISELMKTAWAENVRVVALGSRKMLCGNDSVTGPNRHRSEAFITEKCLDMQKGIKEKETRGVGSEEPSTTKKSGKGSACPFLASKEQVATLALHMLAEPSDIEDLATIGQAVHTCAYYASRESLPAAEVVALPYSILLSKKARDSIGLSLTHNLVLIDEAHNIPEAVRDLHSSILSTEMIEKALSQVAAYVDRYSTRLSHRNLFYIGQIRRFLICSKKFLTSHESCSMMSSTEFLFTLKLDNLNMFKLVRFLEKSYLSRKLLGFNNFSLGSKDEYVETESSISKHVSCMALVESFMKTLTFSELEGKIIAEWPIKDITEENRQRSINHPRFRYVLLNPAAQFADIVKDAHAVVLTAGTLRPFAHLAHELLSMDNVSVREAIEADRLFDEERLKISSTFLGKSLTTFTCSHVVPSTNVHLRCISHGHSGTQLDFRYISKFRDDVCDELGDALIQIFTAAPEGAVVFLPSYSYEAHLFSRWKSTGLFSVINQKKTIYREPSSARDVEGVLESYSKEVQSKKGAVLFSVMGGKMSEGINFSDEKARCVVVVGLPYPDINDPVLKEKMKNMSNIPGAVYYHSVCMRSLGQAIGRSIRHANDYAAILLLDSRYASDKKIWDGLPNWIKNTTDRVVAQQKIGDNMVSELKDFFKSHFQ